jgi:hypothetical protein
MGGFNREPGEGRFWRVRIRLEFVKLGLWIIWEWLRSGGFIGPL